MIKVQREDFDVGRELETLSQGNPRIGGIASFIGLVRDMGGTDRVSALTLEHYPGMTEKKLAEIEWKPMHFLNNVSSSISATIAQKEGRAPSRDKQVPGRVDIARTGLGDPLPAWGC